MPCPRTPSIDPSQGAARGGRRTSAHRRHHRVGQAIWSLRLRRVAALLATCLLQAHAPSIAGLHAPYHPCGTNRRLRIAASLPSGRLRHLPARRRSASRILLRLRQVFGRAETCIAIGNTDARVRVCSVYVRARARWRWLRHCLSPVTEEETLQTVNRPIACPQSRSSRSSG